MTKPSDEWVDAYIDSHPDSCIEDAERAWWDEQIDKGDAEVGTLSPEAEKVSKELRKGRAVDAYGKERKRERKPDPDKREIVDTVAHNLSRVCSEDLTTVEGVEVVNPEREIRFRFRGAEYSLTLTKHRPPKG